MAAGRRPAPIAVPEVRERCGQSLRRPVGAAGKRLRSDSVLSTASLRRPSIRAGDQHSVPARRPTALASRTGSISALPVGLRHFPRYQCLRPRMPRPDCLGRPVWALFCVPTIWWRYRCRRRLSWPVRCRDHPEILTGDVVSAAGAGHRIVWSCRSACPTSLRHPTAAGCRRVRRRRPARRSSRRTVRTRQA